MSRPLEKTYYLNKSWHARVPDEILVKDGVALEHTELRYQFLICMRIVLQEFVGNSYINRDKMIEMPDARLLYLSVMSRCEIQCVAYRHHE